MPAKHSGRVLVRAVVAGLLLAALLVIVRTRSRSVAPDAAPTGPLAGGVVRLADELEHDDDLERRPVELLGQLRDAIVIESAGEIRLSELPFVGGHLRVSLAVEPRKTRQTRATKVLFELRLNGAGDPRTLLREELRAVGGMESEWSDHAIELPALPAGTSLSFSVEFTGPPARAYWGSPMLFPSERGPRPNVILVSIDTLGAKHMSCYGHEEQTTPELDRFAEGAVLFERAIAHQNWTLTSHMSLLTSLYPDTHKVNRSTSLSDELPLLPDLLRAAGYFTAGQASNPYLMPKWGYGRAYDRYAVDFLGNVEDAAIELARLLESPAPEPFFFFLHLIDPHSDWKRLPYESPAPFQPDPPPGGWESVPTCFDGECATGFLSLVNEGEVTLGPEVDLFHSLYDASIRYTDHHLGALFDDLERRGLFDDSIVIVTSDHGEEFLEHGKVMHTQGYDECLHVPLMIKFPAGEHAGLRIPHQVQHVDVMPTVLELLGLERPAHLEGVSLLPLIEGVAPSERIAFAKGLNHSMTERDCYVARTEDWKLIWWLEDGRTALFDLSADPGEAVDLSAEAPDVHDELLGALRQHRQLRTKAGFHVRIPPHDASARLTVTASTSGRFVEVHPANPNSEKRHPKGDLTVADSALTFSLETKSRAAWSAPIGFDFDLEPHDASLQVEIELNGRPLPVERIFLGRTGAHPAETAVTISRDGRALRDEGLPVPIADSAVPHLYVWESESSAAAVHLTEHELSTLEALGYMGGEEEN
jgi:hypothetical protein